MLTRIGIGVLIALALDPLVGSLERRLPGRRGTAVAVVGVGVLSVAALLVLVLGPQAVEQAGAEFSQQLPDTIDQLGKLPLIGGWVQDQANPDEGPERGSTNRPTVHRPTPRRERRDARSGVVRRRRWWWCRSACSSTARTSIGRARR